MDKLAQEKGKPIEYRFNVKTVDIWHDLNQDVNLRPVFNEIITTKDLQFVRHVFSRRDRLFVATKCSINDNPDIYYLPLMKSGKEVEHIVLGNLRSDTLRIFKNGRIVFRCVINKA